jgi:catechol 2,3-dioxygenase-like lactoylglutathione lyase family enzyme
MTEGIVGMTLDRREAVLRWPLDSNARCARETPVSTTNMRSGNTSVQDTDMKLEVVIIPVSDVDRSTEFYQRLGWRKDVTPPGVVQFTPHGSGCSVMFGPDLTSAEPGSASEYLIVSDIEATRDALLSAGVQVGEVFHRGPEGQGSGADPQHRSYMSLAAFNDPDGNSWLLQEITDRLPGRVDATETSYGSATDLAAAMRRASLAHGEHEQRIGQEDADWPAWYAQYMVNEQHGIEPPQ